MPFKRNDQKYKLGQYLYLLQDILDEPADIVTETDSEWIRALRNVSEFINLGDDPESEIPEDAQQKIFEYYQVLIPRVVELHHQNHRIVEDYEDGKKTYQPPSLIRVLVNTDHYSDEWVSKMINKIFKILAEERNFDYWIAGKPSNTQICIRFNKSQIGQDEVHIGFDFERIDLEDPHRMIVNDERTVKGFLLPEEEETLKGFTGKSGNQSKIEDNRPVVLVPQVVVYHLVDGQKEFFARSEMEEALSIPFPSAETMVTLQQEELQAGELSVVTCVFSEGQMLVRDGKRYPSDSFAILSGGVEFGVYDPTFDETLFLYIERSDVERYA